MENQLSKLVQINNEVEINDSKNENFCQVGYLAKKRNEILNQISNLEDEICEIITEKFGEVFVSIKTFNVFPEITILDGDLDNPDNMEIISHLYENLPKIKEIISIPQNLTCILNFERDSQRFENINVINGTGQPIDLDGCNLCNFKYKLIFNGDKLEYIQDYNLKIKITL